MAKNTRTFSDLDFMFGAHPVSGDVNRKFDENAIKQSIKNLILTRNFERPFHSEIGSQVKSMMFENFGPMTTAVIKRSIENTIITFEPRVELLDVEVLEAQGGHSIYVTILFKILNTSTPVSVNLLLERTR